MAAKGSAAKSASGASMSKYDVEVEKRLQALEAEAHPKCHHCLLYTSPSPRDAHESRMPSSA